MSARVILTQERKSVPGTCLAGQSQANDGGSGAGNDEAILIDECQSL